MKQNQHLNTHALLILHLKSCHLKNLLVDFLELTNLIQGFDSACLVTVELVVSCGCTDMIYLRLN